MLIKLRKLSVGERLYLKRKRDGMTQQEMADDYGVSLMTYKMWEQWEARNAPLVAVFNVTQPERCAIKRRRKKYTKQAFADKLGISVALLEDMEAGHAPCDILVDFWEKYQ